METFCTSFLGSRGFAFTAVAEIAHEQRADATLQQFYIVDSEHYCIRVMDNKKLVGYDVKHLIIPICL